MMEFICRYHLHYVFRIFFACVCGVVIGYERKNRAKEAGLRTHCIVACASALMMVLSKYAFYDTEGFPGLRGADSSRIASQVVSGVGFLGAGMIFVQKNTIKGLTTAAGIWATSGIGMAIGSGMYIVGVSSTLIILLVQIILHKNTRFTQMPKNKVLKIYGVKKRGFQDGITNDLHSFGVLINDVTTNRKSDEEGIDFTFYIDVPAIVSEEMLMNLTDYKCKIETLR